MKPLSTRQPVPVLRDVVPDEIADILRAVVGFPLGEPTPGESAATRRRDLPAVIHDVEAGGWIAWCLAGLLVFSTRESVLKAARAESARVAMERAMLLTGGNITRAAEALSISRRSLREGLKKAGLYPWRVADRERSLSE